MFLLLSSFLDKVLSTGPLKVEQFIFVKSLAALKRYIFAMKVIYYLHPLEVLEEQNMTKHNTQPDEVAGPVLSLDDVEVLSVCLSQGK